MLADEALRQLVSGLAAALDKMDLTRIVVGRPELVEESTSESERMFHGAASAKPSDEDAYSAARAVLCGQKLTARYRDLVASALAVPISDASGAMLLGSARLPELLAGYEEEANRGELWRLTWYGLLSSYFDYNPEKATDDASRSGWEALRAFLERTWPMVDSQAGSSLVPAWIEVLRDESAVLSSNPVDKYAGEYLRGETWTTDRLADDLGISRSSWFWHRLVLGAVRVAAALGDAEFGSLIPQLIELIKERPAFRDEALEIILARYHGSKGAPPHQRLRDYVCQSSVWKNPKLKSAGIATAWNRVPDAVWQMVLGWVNERNLKDFFDILAARNGADEGRLEFWSKYLKQITWTRLVFGADTVRLQRTNTAVRDLIAREEGSYAQLTGRSEVDAFIMQIGSYIVVEFSKKPNACYVYKADALPFQRYAKYYDGGTSDLAAGFHGERAARIVHRQVWQPRAAEDLQGLGIFPDRPSTRRVSATDRPDMAVLQALLSRFRGAMIDDRRNVSGGRLWVHDPLQRSQLDVELKAIGFKWAASRGAWYFPES
jgi:hypothetical protein